MPCDDAIVLLDVQFAVTHVFRSLIKQAFLKHLGNYDVSRILGTKSII